MLETWDLVDSSRKPIGKQHVRGNDTLAGEYHIVVEIITLNADGRILLTQRDAQKTHPLLWEGTGGSVTAGESSIIGAVRELEEETGLRAMPDELHLLGEIQGGNYFMDSYVWKSRQPIDPDALKLQAGEVCAAKLARWRELERMNQQGLIVPSVWKRLGIYYNQIASFTKEAAK